jgi:hypothetical protein
MVSVAAVNRWAAIALLVGASAQSHAQTQESVAVPARGAGSYEVGIQYVTITERDLTVLRQEFGEITLRAAYFDFDYGLTDRLALNVTLPFKSNRYVGDQPHDPRLLDDDHGEDFLDDGEYHSNWGDWGVNLRWLWRADRIAITPFVGYYWPSNDYPLFTETQAGTGQWRVDAGLNAGGRIGPLTRNVFWQAGYAYSYMEKTYPTDAPARRVNHSRFNVEFDWMPTPKVTTFLAFAYLMPHNALEFVEMVPWIPSGDQFYWHDRLLPWEYTTWTVGMNYQPSEQLLLSLSYGATQEISFGHIYDPAVTLSVSRGFKTARSGTR